MLRVLLIAVALALVIAGVGWWVVQSTQGAGPQYRLVAVDRGTLTAIVTASGTIQPEDIVDVGAQVNGRIDRFGLDPRNRLTQELAVISAGLPLPQITPNLVLLSPTPPKVIDYNSPVEVGTVLAQIDPTLFQTKVDKARADVQQARADLGQLQAKQRNAEQDWLRIQALAGTKAVAPVDVDLARQAFDSSTAALDSGRAKITLAQAALREAEVDLDYTIIRSPVKGVIIDRRVNIGQTVVSSLNAPSLFLIAKDLKRLQVWAQVNEADIRRIKPGQQAHFTVDTFPQTVFTGHVALDQPRLNATNVSNVVIYVVVVNYSNDDLRLLPYLTANLKFVVEKKKDVLRVPNSTLRWRPKSVSLVHPDERANFQKGQKGASLDSTLKALAGESTDQQGTVWVQDGGYLRPVRVRIGMTDGTMTEILEGDLQAGTELVVGELRQDAGGAASNPFVPNTFGGKKKDQ